MELTRTDASWHSYPSIYNLGHRAVADLLNHDVLIEEKVDGSQFAFGFFPGTDQELRIRSKGAEQFIEAPEKMFNAAAATVKALHALNVLQPGWTYRGEYLAKPKHNALAYDRTPNDHIVLFDIETGDGTFLTYGEKATVAHNLGLEVVPRLFQGRITDVGHMRSFLTQTSMLGGQLIEGVVIKPVGYTLYGIDKKPLLAKFVSESFREVHKQEWKKDNPTTGDAVALIANRYTTPARWTKAVQHLRDAGRITGTDVKDIGPVMKEIPEDILRECREDVMADLFKAFWPEIARRTRAGFPEWYKDQLLRAQLGDSETQ